MPSCPSNRTATQSFSFVGNIPDTISNDFADFGPAKTYVLNQDSTRWQVGLDYVASKKKQREEIHHSQRGSELLYILSINEGKYVCGNI